MGRFDPPSHRSEASPAIDDVVLRALEKEPARRYQRASEVQSDLESADRGERSAGTGPRSTAREAHGTRPSFLAIVSALLFAVSFLPFVFLAALFLGSGGPTSREGGDFASVAGLLALTSGAFGLVLMVTACALGFQALGHIRAGWPKLYGVGAAATGAWGGLLMVANSCLFALAFKAARLAGLWTTPSGGPLVIVLLLFAGDAAFIVWYRKRFLRRA